MAIKCRIWWVDQAQAYAVVSGYNKDVVAALKTIIPSGDRDFDPNTKTWYVKESYGEAIRKIAESAFGIGSVAFTSKTVAEQAAKQSGFAGHKTASNAYLSPQSGTTEDALIAFFGLVPFDAAKRCYLLTAQALHPDKHLDDPTAGTKMAKLNELWSRIEKEFYKR
jgi:hypothetical protein